MSKQVLSDERQDELCKSIAHDINFQVMNLFIGIEPERLEDKIAEAIADKVADRLAEKEGKE